MYQRLRIQKWCLLPRCCNSEQGVLFLERASSSISPQLSWHLYCSNDSCSYCIKQNSFNNELPQYYSCNKFQPGIHTFQTCLLLCVFRIIISVHLWHAGS
ncbi:hypothetical protein R5R35_005481 [Gryllus longicercus]|uniref:Uncharacterized protein n=1 Tax=Gryllus longicercus TaxID=2509291 RepID=A0AAN9W244_9ORTH